MALVLKDRVRETTTTTGTGTLTLAGAVSGFQSFSVIGNGNTTYYCIVDSSTGSWEVGLGTYTSSGTTLSRSTVLESSNSGSAVNFGSGSKDVFCTYPAEKAIYTDASGVSTVTTATNVAGGAANKVVYQTGAGASGFADAPTTAGTSLTWNGSAFTWASAAAFASGTVMLFVQTSAPTGWTKSTTHNDKALRVVSGTASSGGSVAFTTAFASSLSAGATTLSTSQMPSHSHTQYSGRGGGSGTAPAAYYDQMYIDVSSGSTASAGSGGSHTHTLPSFAVSYVDTIIATKD